MQEKVDTFQYVPLEDNLKGLLSNREIFDEVLYLLIHVHCT